MSDHRRMTDSTAGALDWLPGPLAAVSFRLTRVDQAAETLGALAAHWSRSGPVELAQDEDDGRWVARVVGIRPEPPLAALLFSEAVHHLRAAVKIPCSTSWRTNTGHGLPSSTRGPSKCRSSQPNKYLTRRVYRDFHTLGQTTTRGNHRSAEYATSADYELTRADFQVICASSSDVHGACQSEKGTARCTQPGRWLNLGQSHRATRPSAAACRARSPYGVRPRGLKTARIIALARTEAAAAP